MQQNKFRTYRRRKVTRTSGFHTSEGTTGGECLLMKAERVVCSTNSMHFKFYREKLELVELFENGISIVAFGGYVFSNEKASIKFSIEFEYENQPYSFTINSKKVLDAGVWENIGFHIELTLNKDLFINNVKAGMLIESSNLDILDFISFDLDVVSKEDFIAPTFLKHFYQKTNMHIPYLYYLKTTKSFTEYLVDKKQYDFKIGKTVVLKSCNRCARYLPINIEDELKTLSFSLHCKKNAPCTHSTFRSYTIKNISKINLKDFPELNIQDLKVISYHGHQLECKACKKFFVNAPLNPQRTPQQFKEDGLRRRAIEILVNNLLRMNLIHFEFEKKTKKEFSEYIWKKFDKRCFKCGPNSKPLKLKEMALDHTMPLAYLYRLDESATCLCQTHNSEKSDSFPVDFYTARELEQLSNITGLSLEYLKRKEVNPQVLDLLIKNIKWFYDCFLMAAEYQKRRDGILTADKINDSLKRVIGHKTDLAKEYYLKTGKLPTSITTKDF